MEHGFMRAKISKRILIVIGVLLISGIISAFTYGNWWGQSPSFGLDEGEKIVNVMIGCPPERQTLESYIEERSDVLTRLAADNADSSIEALLVFRNYLTNEQLRAFIKANHLAVSGIWATAPKDCGNQNPNHKVENNNIGQALDNIAELYFDSAVNSTDLMVYGILVNGTRAGMDDLKDNPALCLVDPHYHADAEKLAMDKKYRLKYYDCPLMPTEPGRD
ncbi:hypothetical protein [Syntrophomonas curvata]